MRARIGYVGGMAIYRDDTEERQVRMDALIERYRDDQQRRLLKRAVALWRRTEADRVCSGNAAEPPVEKVH